MPWALAVLAIAAAGAAGAEPASPARVAGPPWPPAAPAAQAPAPVAASAAPAPSARSRVDANGAISTWRELGDAYESARLLNDAERLPALRSIERSLPALLRGGSDDERRAAARFLSARLRSDLGDRAGAAAGFADAAGRGPYADDAAFAEIEALEASGRDAEAAKQWLKWEKRFPESPLVPAARLARSWNALRQGQVADAVGVLTQLAVDSPWIAKDQRFVLALALAQFQSDRVTQALATLGERPTTAPALYLRGLCLARSGQALKAAAAWQAVSDRWGKSPLADHARLAKANTFLAARDYRSAAEEMARVAALATDPGVRAEAQLRAAGAVFMGGGLDSAMVLLREVVSRYGDSDVAARAQFLLGEVMVARGQFEPAIAEYNQVLSRFFQHKVAASAQYKVARCLDALNRRADATGSYQAVVSGYPLEPEAPAAAYLAGVGLLRRHLPRAAAPYFQIVLDRYARAGADDTLSFARPGEQELVEASLCMLEWSWHEAGDMGQVAGAPHVLLQKLPPSHSAWRAWALLIDADATAALGRYVDAQAALEKLASEFPDHPVAAPATQLLAWTYARQGNDSLAVATEERLLARWGAAGDQAIVSTACLDISQARFNQKRYREAAAGYEDFLRRWPTHPQRASALYQAGLCYLRLNRAGDAVDRWEALVRDSSRTELAERAWARAGDVYFQAERFDDARRCYRGLLENFAASSAAGLASLRLAQCEYNAGRDAEALQAYSATIERYPGTPYATEAQRGTEQALYRLAASTKGDEELARLVEQYPSSAFAADALVQIGKRRYQAKRWREAAESFRQVVSRFPSYSAADQAQFLMADALAHAGAADEARDAYQQFLSYFPESELRATASFRLGLLRFDEKDYMQAAVAFTRALEDSAPPEVRAPARYNLALCQRQLGDLDQARAELERYRAEFPSGPQVAQASFQLADLDETGGHMSEAASGFAGALALHPDPALAAEIGFRLGRCREQLGEGTAAIRAYVQAAACPDLDQPYRLSAVARLAALYEARHEFAHALAAYRDLIRNSKDRELIAAATDRVSQLSGTQRPH